MCIRDRNHTQARLTLAQRHYSLNTCYSSRLESHTGSTDSRTEALQSQHLLHQSIRITHRLDWLSQRHYSLNTCYTSRSESHTGSTDSHRGTTVSTLVTPVDENHTRARLTLAQRHYSLNTCYRVQFCAQNYLHNVNSQAFSNVTVALS